MILECYAIRQISTGFFLPMRWDKARGYSFDEPTEGAFPRLFKSERSAKSALRAWLQGTWSEPEYDTDEWSQTEYVCAYSPVKVDGRDRSDMEVVKLALTDDRGAIQFFESILKDTEFIANSELGEER